MYSQFREAIWLAINTTFVLAIAAGCGGSNKSGAGNMEDEPIGDTVDAETEENASHYMTQAGLELSEGNDREALQNYLEAAKIYDNSGKVVIERAEAHFLAAQVASKLEDFDVTLREYDAAVQIYLRFSGNSQIKAAIALNNMGTIYKIRHDSAKAKKCWEKALELYKQAPPDLQNQSNMAMIEQNLSDLAEGF